MIYPDTIYPDTIYPWQASQWQVFIHAWRQERLGHAYLCHGPAGTGKHRFAESLAALFLCQAPLSTGLPCQVCRSCILVRAGNHPDFHRVTPESSAQFIKIDQVRELNHYLAHSSSQAGRQCVVISPADAMNSASQNALLKTLEEPSSDCLMVLISSQPELLAPTIRSRCQSIYFSLPEQELAQSWLQKEKHITSEEAKILCHIQAGAPLSAAAVHNSDFFAYRQAVFQALFQLQKSVWVSHIVDELMALSAPFETILSLLFSINLDCWRLSLGVPAEYLIHQDQLIQLKKINTVLGIPEYLTTLLRFIQEKKTNAVNENLMLETLLLRWQRMRISHAC